MTEITAALVKTLRDRTGSGMMACKNALVSTGGDIERAIDHMRKAGQATAAKKAERIATEGVILLSIDQQQKRAVLVEINCETDFVARDSAFLTFGEHVADQAMQIPCHDLDHLNLNALNAACEKQRVALITNFGENIYIRRFSILKGECISGYLHDNRIGVVVAASATTDMALIKQIAMHIAASKPEYISLQHVPTEAIQRERQIQLAIAQQSGNSAEIAEKMVEGRLRKFTSGLVLTEQLFVMDTNTRVGDLLRASGAEITSFVRFEVGEGLVKTNTDFVAAVSEVTATSKPT